jgi:hypothetical protein
MSKKTRKIKNQEGGKNIFSAAKNVVTTGVAAAKQKTHAAAALAATQATALGAAAAKAVGKALVPNSITELSNKYLTNHAAIDNWLTKNASNIDADTKAVVDLIELLKTIVNAPSTNVAETKSIKQKYLKYKQKYLELKQQLNQI